MGLFGGSKSSSSTSIDNSQTTYEQNESSSLQAGTLGLRGDNNQISVNQLDGGAITQAFNFGKSALDTSMAQYQTLTTGLFDQAKNAQQSAANSISKGIEAANLASQRVSEAYGQANQKPTTINTNLILLAGLVVAALVFKK